jgi:hypothetical protein
MLLDYRHCPLAHKRWLACQHFVERSAQRIQIRLSGGLNARCSLRGYVFGIGDYQTILGYTRLVACYSKSEISEFDRAVS